MHRANIRHGRGVWVVVALLAGATACKEKREGSVIPGTPASRAPAAVAPVEARGVPEAPPRTDLAVMASSQAGIAVFEGLVGPETAIHDTVADVYLLSNVNGVATEADDNGFISRISPSGAVVDLKWIDGTSPEVTLHGPKGMVLDADTLYVADVDAVRRFDRRTGIQKESWPVTTATFLNDVTLDGEGRLILTDTGVKVTPQGPVKAGDFVIYRFDTAGKPQRLAEGDALAGPNGIEWSKKGLHFVTFMGDRLLRLEGGKPVEVTKLPAEWYDGFVQLPDGTSLVTSWKSRAVYHVDPSRNPRMVAGDLISPAGVHYDVKRRRILVPLLSENQLRILPWDYENAPGLKGTSR